jgi:hypothetical protein
MDITRVHSSGQVASSVNEAITQLRVSNSLVELRCLNSKFLVVPPSSVFGKYTSLYEIAQLNYL